MLAVTGSWGAGTEADGLYRISVETRDEAGNATARSRLDFSGGFSGSVAVPALGTTRLGPFNYMPTADEAASNEGHRCMLAMFTSDDDPIRLGVD